MVLSGALSLGLSSVSPVWAGIEDWQVNEIVTSASGDDEVRYIELYNEVGGCLFASTRVRVYGSGGAIVGTTTLVATTTCYEPGRYFVLASPRADAALGMSADHLGAPALPTDAAQVCFEGTSTRYDCVRWGTIAQPVTDILGFSDATSAAPPPDSQALSRVAVTHVIEDDWQVTSPTPGGPIEDPPWVPVDAGPMPDASAVVDAGPGDGDAGAIPDAGGAPDAGEMTVDARVSIDAKNERFLDLDPAGGADCSCRVGRRDSGAGGAPWIALCFVVVWVWRSGMRTP